MLIAVNYFVFKSCCLFFICILDNVDDSKRARSDVEFRWEWEMSKNKWKAYPSKTNKLVNDALAAKKAEVRAFALVLVERMSFIILLANNDYFILRLLIVYTVVY